MKKYSRFVILPLIFCFVFALGSHSVNAASVAQVYVQGGVSIYIDGQRQEYSYQADVEKGTTLTPLRGIFESLGASVNWNSKSQTIEAHKGNTKIWLKIGSRNAKVNGKTVTLSVPAKVQYGRTLVPLRFISEALGENVQWDSSTRSIYIGNLPTLGKLVSAVPKGANVVEKGIGFTNYSYTKSLPGGGKITEVHVFIPDYEFSGRIKVSIVAYDHEGNFLLGGKFSSGEDIESYSFMGKRPILGADDFYEINLLASQFLEAYGL